MSQGRTSKELNEKTRRSNENEKLCFFVSWRTLERCFIALYDGHHDDETSCKS